MYTEALGPEKLKIRKEVVNQIIETINKSLATEKYNDYFTKITVSCTFGNITPTQKELTTALEKFLETGWSGYTILDSTKNLYKFELQY